MRSLKRFFKLVTKKKKKDFSNSIKKRRRFFKILTSCLANKNLSFTLLNILVVKTENEYQVSINKNVIDLSLLSYHSIIKIRNFFVCII